MKSMLISLLASFAVSVAALFVVYPWSLYQSGSDFSWQETLVSYLILAGIMAIPAGVVLPLALRGFLSRPGPSLKVGVVLAVASLGVNLLIVLLFSGPGLFLNVPGTRVRGLFFSEWQFVVFFFQVGVPFSLVNGVLQVWLRHRAMTGGAAR